MPSALRRGLAPALALAALALPAAAHAALPAGPEWYKDPSVNATWTQIEIPSTDGVMLHADVLRPKGLPATTKTPVILSIGPYFNHSGQEGPAGVTASGTPYSADGEAGPSTRFEDFVVGAHLMQKGYTYVMADLRGFGGSTGCQDWVGPGEQADVKKTVEYLASRGWSNGKVGIYGKSYDGVTGLVGVAQQPKGLAAVVSQEPVFDLYRYLYSNAVKFENALATPALYDAIASTPGVGGGDSIAYQEHSLNTPDCNAENYASQATDDNHTDAYWDQRNLIAETKGKKTPVLLTQGFLENNTKPDGSWDVFNGLAGPKRGWFGMWDHIRGNDQAEGDDVYQPWFGEVMRWFDLYLDGGPADTDPPVEVETNDGTWRAETDFPPKDSKGYTTKLNVLDASKANGYTDDGKNVGSNDENLPSTYAPGSEGDWTFSPAFTHDEQFSGVPEVKLDLTPTVPVPDPGMSTSLTGVNVAVDVYDVDAKGVALILSRTTALIPKSGKLDLEMYGNDWHIPAGHRIGVLISSANAEWWAHVPSMSPVTVNSASITLPFLSYLRPDHIPGKRPARLAAFLKAAPFTIPVSTITANTSTAFAMPPERTAAPAGALPPTTTTATTTPPSTTTTTGTTTTPPPTTQPTTQPTTTTTPEPSTSTTTTPEPGTTTDATSTTPPATVGLTTTIVPGTPPGETPATPKALPSLSVALAVPHGHGSRRVHVTGRAAAGSSVTIVLRRNGKRLATRRVTADAKGRYRVDFRVKKAGKYTARISVPAGTTAKSSVVSRTSNVHINHTR